MNREPGKISQFFAGLLRIGVGFLKAQAIFFVINVVVITVCLLIFKIKFSFLIALGISLLDFLPIVGSGLAFLPWIIVCIIQGNSTMAWQLAALYIGLVVLRQVLDPIITGKQVGLRPIIALAAALAGLLLLGLAGIIIGPIIAAVVDLILKISRTKNTGA